MNLEQIEATIPPLEKLAALAPVWVDPRGGAIIYSEFQPRVIVDIRRKWIKIEHAAMATDFHDRPGGWSLMFKLPHVNSPWLCSMDLINQHGYPESRTFEMEADSYCDKAVNLLWRKAIEYLMVEHD